MKKRLLLFFVLSSIMTFAQHQIKGTLKPFDKDVKWAMLYRITEGKQVYVKNANIDNKSFYFEIPSSESSGVFRIVYKSNGASFLDVLYNKEDISFKFDPDYPEETVVYSKSAENKMYQSYIQEAFGVQQYLDSLQMSYFKSPSVVTSTVYQEAYFELKDVQKEYQKKSKNMLAFNFIKASQRYNSKNVIEEPQEYLDIIKQNFFEHIDFEDNILINSPFLIDRSIDYIFNLNYSQDPIVQHNLYKESISRVMAIPKKEGLQKDLIEILIEEFVAMEDVEMVKYLLDNDYKKLPKELQSATYIEHTLEKVSVVIGTIAPDFNWGDNKQLSTINTHKNYIIVFWSTSCSHCVEQLPEVHSFLKKYKDIQVIAIALEKDAKEWDRLIPSLSDWEHVLGLGKWENSIARSYHIESTPSYVIVDTNKKIVALPEGFSQLKSAITDLD